MAASGFKTLITLLVPSAGMDSGTSLAGSSASSDVTGTVTRSVAVTIFSASKTQVLVTSTLSTTILEVCNSSEDEAGGAVLESVTGTKPSFVLVSNLTAVDAMSRLVGAF